MKRNTRRDFVHECFGEQIRVKVNPGAADDIPLLICGGFGVALDVLDDVVSGLDGATVIRFDAPGIGGSLYRFRPYRFSRLSRVLESLIGELDYDQVDVMGISWGGMLAQEFALKFPGRCRKLILASTLSGVISLPGNIILNALLSPARWAIRKPYSRLASLIYGGKVLKSDWRKLERFLAVYPTDLPGYLGQVSAVVGWTSIHRLHKLFQPVLLLYGREDPVIPMINAKLFKLAIPNARLIEMESGHLFPWTCRDRMCREILKFRSENNASHSYTKEY